jgi:hypothetical protein
MFVIVTKENHTNLRITEHLTNRQCSSTFEEIAAENKGKINVF